MMKDVLKVYVSEELKLAMQDNYEVIQIFEVWHWPESDQYDRVTKKGGIFTKYIDMFLKGIKFY